MCVAAFPKTQASTSLVRKGRNGVTHTSIRNRAGGNNWNMSAAQLDEAFYHLSLPCMSRIFIGKNCLALPTGMQRGGGFLVGSSAFLLSAFLFLFGATPIPYRIIMSFCFSFRSPSLVSFGCFCSYFRTISALGPPLQSSIFLSLMRTSQRIG